jgi:hypothetical protein
LRLGFGIWHGDSISPAILINARTPHQGINGIAITERIKPERRDRKYEFTARDETEVRLKGGRNVLAFCRCALDLFIRIFSLVKIK